MDTGNYFFTGDTGNERLRCRKRLACEALRAQSDILAGLEREGKIVIAGSLYNVAKGEVEFTMK